MEAPAPSRKVTCFSAPDSRNAAIRDWDRSGALMRSMMTQTGVHGGAGVWNAADLASFIHLERCSESIAHRRQAVRAAQEAVS